MTENKNELVVVPPNKIGRKPKSDYWLTDEGLQRINEWVENGLSMKQLSQNMGISYSTLFEWQNNFPELSDTIKKGQRVVTEHVENALFNSATGYEYEEETSELMPDGEMKVVKKVKKSQAPNPTSMIFWLKNKNPEEWRDRVEVKNEHEGKIIIEMGEMEKWSN